MVLILDAQAVRAVLSMKDCIDIVEKAFAELALSNVVMPLRSTMRMARHDGVSLYMPAYVGGQIEALACKIVTVYKSNPAKFNLPTILGTVLVQNPRTGAVECIMNGGIVTAMRTGAVSGVAAKYLARKNSKIVGLFGAGTQARTQLEAISEVVQVEECLVYDTSPDAARKLANDMSSRLAIKVAAVSYKPVDVDIILTATTATSPILDGSKLKEGTFISGVGSHAPDSRELDTETIKKSKLVVDQRSACLAEAGDILIPIKEGAISADHIYAELGELILKKKDGRTDEKEITLFKSVGLAVQDAATAELVYERASTAGIGVQVAL